MSLLIYSNPVELINLYFLLLHINICLHHLFLQNRIYITALKNILASKQIMSPVSFCNCYQLFFVLDTSSTSMTQNQNRCRKKPLLTLKTDASPTTTHANIQEHTEDQIPHQPMYQIRIFQYVTPVYGNTISVWKRQQRKMNQKNRELD